MNKTVTINISGIIFHIEEDAFDKLSKYLSTIKGYFSKTDGGNEIMSDIEARIAEMLQGKTSAIKQVVLMADVDSVIETMGKPEEFVEGATDNSHEGEDTEYTTTEPTKRRLFRDPDHKAVGGVCSGIAAYFDVDMIWIRLAMFLLIFFGGLSLWIYIILWIVIPEAKTTADKLAMKGEKIDINNISKTVKEEAQQFKKRMDKYGNEIKNSGQNFSDNSQNFFDKLGNFIKEFLIIFTKFFARIIGLILLIFGVMFMLGLISSVFGFSIVGANTELNDWINLFFMERSHYVLGLIGIILFFGIPFIMMIYGGVKLLFKIHYSNRWLNISAGLIWLVGLITVLFVGISTGQDFNEVGKVKDPIQLNMQRDTIYLSLLPNKELYKQLNVNEEDLEDYDDQGNRRTIHSRRSDYIVAKTDKKKFIVGYATLNILPASGDNFELYIIKKARGADKRAAVERAKVINYDISQNDSTILFNEIFTVLANEKFRVQEVQVVLKVPRGKVIYLDKSLTSFMYDIENVTNTYDGDMVDRRWIMGANGLECVDCEGLLDYDELEKKGIHPPPPPGAPGTINVDAQDAKVNINENGIHVNSKDANVNISKNGIHIDTKGDKGNRGEK
jgi:phage shock protein PspC (stress-responsive transcriptional regulator)